MIKKQKMKMKKIGWFFMLKFLMHKYIRSTHFLRMKQVYTEIGSFHFLSKYDKLTYKLKYNYDGFFSSEKTFDCSPEVLHLFKWFLVFAHSWVELGKLLLEGLSSHLVLWLFFNLDGVNSDKCDEDSWEFHGEGFLVVV